MGRPLLSPSRQPPPFFPPAPSSPKNQLKGRGCTHQASARRGVQPVRYLSPNARMISRRRRNEPMNGKRNRSPLINQLELLVCDVLEFVNQNVRVPAYLTAIHP